MVRYSAKATGLGSVFDGIYYDTSENYQDLVDFIDVVVGLLSLEGTFSFSMVWVQTVRFAVMCIARGRSSGLRTSSRVRVHGHC